VDERVRLAVEETKKFAKTAMDSFLFEINDEITRGRILRVFQSYLDDFISRTGFYRAMVIFGNDMVWGKILFKPTESAEMICIAIDVSSFDFKDSISGRELPVEDDGQYVLRTCRLAPHTSTFPVDVSISPYAVCILT
jgi:hypothetical protein